MELLLYRFENICSMRPLFKDVSKVNITFNKNSTETAIFLNETYKF